MAYLRSLIAQCQTTGCVRQRTVQLVNRRNAEVGEYCREHGAKALRQLKNTEEREDAHASQERRPTSVHGRM